MAYQTYKNERVNISVEWSFYFNIHNNFERPCLWFCFYSQAVPEASNTRPLKLQGGYDELIVFLIC